MYCYNYKIKFVPNFIPLIVDTLCFLHNFETDSPLAVLSKKASNCLALRNFTYIKMNQSINLLNV